MRKSILPMVIAVLALCAFSPPATFAATAWNQYGFSSRHTSFNKMETTLTSGNVANLAFLWAGSVGKPLVSGPTVGRGNVYVAADGEVFAFRASDGASLWSHLSCSGIGAVQPALSSHALLVGDDGGDLAAYDPATGSQLWCRDESGSITSPPSINAGVVYISNGSSVVAVDIKTGNTLWIFTPVDFSRIDNTPAVTATTVYATSGDSLFALDRTTGHKIWRIGFGPQIFISAPSVANGLVYVGGNSLFAVNASTGKLRWTKNNVGVIVSMPAIADGNVYVNAQDPNFGLFAFNAVTGKLVWRSMYPDEPVGTVTVANGVVYDIADTGDLQLFDSATGVFLGSLDDPGNLPFNSDFRIQPAVVKGTVYLPTGNYGGGNRIDAFTLPLP